MRAGAGLLGWVAGDIMAKDSALENVLQAATLEQLHLGAAIAGTVFVLACGWWLRRSRHQQSLIVDPPGPEQFPHQPAEARQRVSKDV